LRVSAVVIDLEASVGADPEPARRRMIRTQDEHRPQAISSFDQEPAPT
jgi:citrate lyase beta subunit